MSYEYLMVMQPFQIGCIPFTYHRDIVTPIRAIAPPTGCGIWPVPNRNLVVNTMKRSSKQRSHGQNESV